MERRRMSGAPNPMLTLAAPAAADEALQLCAALRAAAADTPTCKRDCRTLSRFVGKVMLILEGLQAAMAAQAQLASSIAGASTIASAPTVAAAQACQQPASARGPPAGGHQQLAGAPSERPLLQQQLEQQHRQFCPVCGPAANGGEQQPSAEALAAAWAEAAGDVREALSAASELVTACRAMGRLQAVLEAEEMRQRFSAAARDLGLALSGLQALAPAAPADVAEDVASVQRQLGGLRFGSAAAQEQLAAQLLQAVVLHHLRQCEGGDGVAPLLGRSLGLAGLDPAHRDSWLDFEVARLRDAAAAAAAAGDPITEFFYKQVLMCLLAHQCGAWGPLPPAGQQQQQQPAKAQQAEQQAGTQQGGDPAVAAAAAAAAAAVGRALQHVPSNDSSAAGVGTPPVADGTPHKCTSDGSSLLLSDGSAAAAAAAVEQQAGAGQSPQQGRLARLHQLLATWEGGRSGASSTQQSPQGAVAAAALRANGCSTELLVAQQQLAVPESPLSDGTLASLLGALQAEGEEEALRGLDPADGSTVVAALQSPSELAQFAAAVLVERRLEGGSEADRAELVGLGAVPKLLRVLQSSRQPLLRASVASSFRHLARDAPMRAQLADAGAIPALSLLLQSPSSSARQAAARAVSNLVVNCETSKIEAAKFGAIHSLARMLEAPDAPLLQEAASAALANLAANSGEAQALIASAGAIPLLVGVLRGGTPAAKQHAARAIRNLAGRDTTNKLRAAEAGGIPLLMALMAGCGCCSSDASRQAAASALSNIACNCEQTQRQIADEGALPLVCDMLHPSGGCGLACREAAAWLLGNLACCAAVRTRLSKETDLLRAAVAGLLDLLRSGGDTGGAAAARAIKTLSAGHSNSNKVAIAEAGAIPLLVGLLRSPKDATRKAAASALWNLAYRNNPNRKGIVLAGAIPLLVDLLRAGSSEGGRQEAARALSNLSCNNDVGQGVQMLEAGAVPLLVEMMRTSNAAGKEAAVGAISNLACIRAHQQAILEAGAPPVLLELMQAGSSAGCQEAAARGFGNLVCDSLSDTLRPVAYKAVPLLVGIISGPGNGHSGHQAATAAASSKEAGGGRTSEGGAGGGTSDGARQAAARAISNLVCSDVTVQVLVARSGAASALVELCRSPNEELREAAAVALWDLAYDCSLGREAIARAGAVPWLSQLLLFGGAGAKEAAAACLAELAAVGPAVQQQIRDAGAVQLLEALQKSEVGEVAMAATEALRSLEANSSRRNSASAPPAPAAAAAPAQSSSAGDAAPGPSGAAGQPAMATAGSAGLLGTAGSKLGSWGRRGSQKITLEQAPPEVAAAEAEAAAAAAAAAVSPPAAPAVPTLPVVPPTGAPAGPARGPLSPGRPPLPSPGRGGQPQVQSVPLPTSPFANDVMPSPSAME